MNIVTRGYTASIASVVLRGYTIAELVQPPAEFFIDSQNRQQVITVNQRPKDAESRTIDFSPWVDDFGGISTVTWTRRSGTATISNETVLGNVVSAVITTPYTGSSMIRITASNSTHSANVYLLVTAL